MTDKIYCEKCQSEMIDFENEGSCGMTCPNCGWGWATTKHDPIKLDANLYEIAIEGLANPSIDFIKVVSKSRGCNFIEAKTFLLQGGILQKSNASIIKETAKLLEQGKFTYRITPNFPYSLD